MAPAGARSVAQPIVGTFAGLVALAVVAAMFITAEYRRGLIRVTLTASPRRGRVLAAKAVVVGAAVRGGAARRLGRAADRRADGALEGIFIDPVSTLTAAFAVQQPYPAYPQVAMQYTPQNGYYPLAPWAGFAVLCGWTALTLGRRRPARRRPAAAPPRRVTRGGYLGEAWDLLGERLRRPRRGQHRVMVFGVRTTRGPAALYN